MVDATPWMAALHSNPTSFLSPQERKEKVRQVWEGFYNTYKTPAAITIQRAWRRYAARKRRQALLRGRLLACGPQRTASAAVVIQRHFRGWLCRQQTQQHRQELLAAVVVAQSRWRGRAARRKARELELLRSTHWPQAAAVLQHHVRCWLARRQLQRLAQAESNVVGSAGYGAAAACIQSSAADAERCGSGAAAEAATRTIALPPQARGFDRPATKLRGAKPPAGPDQLVKPAWRPSAQHPQRGEAAGGARQHAEAGDAASATGRAAAAGTLRAAPTQHQQAVGVAGDQRTQRQAAQLPPASPSPAKGPSALPVAPSRPLLRSSQTSSKPLQQVRRTPQQPRGSATGGSSVRSSDAGSSSSTAVSDDELFVGSAVRPLHEQALRVRRREHAQLVQQTAPNKAAPGVNK